MFVMYNNIFILASNEEKIEKFKLSLNFYKFFLVNLVITMKFQFDVLLDSNYITFTTSLYKKET